MKRVEHIPGWGWVARKPDGEMIVDGFFWRTRAVARDVVAEYDMIEAMRPIGVEPRRAGDSDAGRARSKRIGDAMRQEQPLPSADSPAKGVGERLPNEA